MNGRALSLTANTEGEKDGRAGRNAILQRSLFKSTLSIQYIFCITWLTSLQFSDLILKFCSLIDNLLIPNFLKISKFKILRDTSAFHVIPSLNISSRLEQTVSSWMKKKERKRRRGILSRMKTRRSKKHVVRNIDTFTESGDLADQCRVLHSRSHILYEAISLPGLEGRIRRFTNSFQFLISGSRLNFFGRWMDEEIRFNYGGW